ncbi:uncharacterized protein LOC135955755 [Calliphora vicina]|uniref:uncharacterized protein LOC135955755 n=1 Tax=Calliphora vicina TaxID=7373 RepID=UPI00325A956F
MFLVFQILWLFSLLLAPAQSFIRKPNISSFIDSLSYIDPFPFWQKEIEDKPSPYELEEELDVWPEYDDKSFDIEPQNEPLQQVCDISIRKDIEDPKQPLFIKTGTTEFYPYDSNGVMSVATREDIELVCTQGFASPIQGYNVIATCVDGLNFMIAGRSRSLDSVTCASWNKVTTRVLSNSCPGGTKFIDVGFELTPMRFASLYQVCFNEDFEVTRYVQHTLRKGANFYQNAPRPGLFERAGFFQEDLEKVFTKRDQKLIVDMILGADSSRFFSANIYFLVRGHLAAKADFVLGSQQRATFFYINTAPQWQSFNGNNWLAVENGLRKWVHMNKLDLNCWTGVYGVTTLPNLNNIPTPLYLYVDMNNNMMHGPVPKLFFKIAIEPFSKRGIVLVGVNNPHLTLAEIKQDYILCPDVSDRVTYVNWKKTDIRKGYMYACEVSEFRKVVTHLPTFDVSGLLL